MHFHPILALILTCLPSYIITALAQQLAILDTNGEPPITSPFILSSIFARQLKPNPDHSSAQVHSPPPPLIPLRPAYQLRDFDYAFNDNKDDEIDDYSPYSGIETFAHLNWTNCFAAESNSTFDIAIIGAPFDLGVSFRPGARFGPSGARSGARRMDPGSGWDMDHKVNPFRDWATVTDCGDIGNTPFDKLEAIAQLQRGWDAINRQSAKNVSVGDAVRIISIGGDHTITLPILRALHSIWGRVAVLHFDSHLDTWDPKQLGGGLTKYSQINHGTMLHIAHEEGLLSNHSNMHLGSRSMLFDEHIDLNNDLRCGFSYIRARELDKLGVDKIVEKIKHIVGTEFVYLSVDIDVLDPAFAPATGTIEPGGWTTRELLEILDGLSDAGLKIVGADVVEFTPVYDNTSETTGIAVGSIIYQILQWMIRVPVKRP